MVPRDARQTAALAEAVKLKPEVDAVAGMLVDLPSAANPAYPLTARRF
jgi:hypothetical protein